MFKCRNRCWLLLLPYAVACGAASAEHSEGQRVRSQNSEAAASGSAPETHTKLEEDAGSVEPRSAEPASTESGGMEALLEEGDASLPSELAPSTCDATAEVSCGGTDRESYIGLEVMQAVEFCRPNTCGEWELTIDANGCGVKFEGDELYEGLASCVLRRLASKRYTCAAGTTQKSRVSCTTL